MNNPALPEVSTDEMNDYILVDDQSSLSDQKATIENPSSTQERPATLPDIPNLHFNHTIAADKPEQRAILPDISERVIATDVEEQPRAITWSDIKSASIWPQVLFALLHIPAILHGRYLIFNLGILRPWADISDELCGRALMLVAAAIFILLVAMWSHLNNHDDPPLGISHITLPFLWQLLVALHLESIELSSWWWTEMAMWGVGVAGGQLLLLAIRVWAGEYAWPQASQEERRKALEAAHICDLEKGVEPFEGGKWITMEEVTDEFIAEVFDRPKSGFSAAVYFFHTICIVLPLLITLYTGCIRVKLEIPWQGNQFLANVLFFVVLSWLMVMLAAVYALRDLPEGLPESSITSFQMETMLGGCNTSMWRMKKVMYESSNGAVVRYRW